MTLDKLVADDLRALAMASRQALVPLERSIAAVAPREVVDARLVNPVLVVGSRIYCHRIARATAAFVLFASTVIAVIGLDPFENDRTLLKGGSAISFLLQPTCLVLAVAIAAAVAYLLALGVAASLFEWYVRRAIERGISSEYPESGIELARRLLQRPERSGIIIETAGVTALVLVAVVAACSIGGESWSILAYPHLGSPRGFVDFLTIWYMVIAIGVAATVAVTVGIVAGRPRWRRALISRAMTTIATVVGLFGLYILFASDEGTAGVVHTWDGDFVFQESVRGLSRVVVPVMCTISFGILIAQGVLWLRRRELAMLSGDARPISDGDRVIVAMASVYERRVARIGFGALCFLAMIAVLVGYQQWDGNWDPNYNFLEAVRRQDPIVTTALVGLFAVVVQVVTRTLARRRFERRITEAPAMLEAGRRLIANVDRPAMAIGMGGVTAALVMFGIDVFAAGMRPWDGDIRWRWDPSDAMAISALGLVVVAFAAFRIAKKLPGRRGVRSHFLENKFAPLVAIIIGLWVLFLGQQYDTGFDLDMLHTNDSHQMDAHQMIVWPDYIVGTLTRSAFTIAGALVAVGILFGATLARRRREMDRLGLS